MNDLDSTSQRERGKKQRKLLILKAASEEFKRHGFDKTRIDEIAKLAGVATGTVYNYFPTKDLLLLEMVAVHRDQMPTALIHLITSPPADPIEAFVAFYRLMGEESLRYLDKPLWRHALAAFATGSWAETDEKRWRHEHDLMRYQASMLKLLQHGRSLPETIDVTRMVEIIHACGFFWWHQFLERDDFSFEDFILKLRGNFEILLPMEALSGPS